MILSSIATTIGLCAVPIFIVTLTLEPCFPALHVSDTRTTPRRWSNTMYRIMVMQRGPRSVKIRPPLLPIKRCCDLFLKLFRREDTSCWIYSVPVRWRRGRCSSWCSFPTSASRWWTSERQCRRFSTYSPGRLATTPSRYKNFRNVQGSGWKTLRKSLVSVRKLYFGSTDTITLPLAQLIFEEALTTPGGYGRETRGVSRDTLRLVLARDTDYDSSAGSHLRCNVVRLHLRRRGYILPMARGNEPGCSLIKYSTTNTRRENSFFWKRLSQAF